MALKESKRKYLQEIQKKIPALDGRKKSCKLNPPAHHFPYGPPPLIQPRNR
jgi:hypothetical protein